MKTKYKKIFSRNFFIISALFLLITSCLLAITGVDYPDSVTANQEATFVMHIKGDTNGDGNNGQKLVIAVLMPISWNAKNSKVTYKSSLDEDGQILNMSLIPDNVSPANYKGKTWPEALNGRLGVGPNVLTDMEWVAFQSDKSYNIANGANFTGDVTIKTIIGPKNLRAKIGFFANDSGDGFGAGNQAEKRFSVFYSDCVTVLGGEGIFIDFCELHFNAVQPLSATKNDFLTFKFQGDIKDNPLSSATDVHLCATAYTINGNSYQICNSDINSKMKKASAFGNTYAVTIWPAQYFNIPENEELKYIEYSFANQDGSVKLAEEDGSPYIYNFECK